MNRRDFILTGAAALASACIPIPIPAAKAETITPYSADIFQNHTFYVPIRGYYRVTGPNGIEMIQRYDHGEPVEIIHTI